MANIKNLPRLGQIADALPKLEQARTLLSDEGATISVTRLDKDTLQTQYVALPPELRMNVANAVNLAINSLKEELQKL